MNDTNQTYRIRTEVGVNKNLTVKLEQDYNTFEILSLKLTQEDAYRLQSVNYGVVVGRVLANGGFGVPNAKVSVFIESDDETLRNVVLAQLYPYTSTRDTADGVRYNLLPDKQVDTCHRAVGTFPNKTYVLDNDDIIEIFDKYYKYTTRTNNAGDYIICGVPTGTQTIHMDLDLSDCGILSQKPRDFYYKGYNVEQFENPNQFKTSTDLDSLSQIFSQDQVVNVIPFWGNRGQGETIGVTRCDIDINFKFEPTCVFIGSIVSDSASNGLSKKCIPTNTMGAMDELVTGEGTIEMIRKTANGDIEEFQIKGTELINSDGVWCYQIPMNLDYMMTDEYGNMVPTDNPDKGIPTRTSVRFRVSMHDNEENTDNYFLSKVLVPNNPKTVDEVDFNFGSSTKDTSFRDLYWNNVYSIKSYIPRFQNSMVSRNERFTGIKHCNINGNNNPMPYNNIRIRLPLMFTILCALIKSYIWIVYFVNRVHLVLQRFYGILTLFSDDNIERPARRAYFENRFIVLGEGLCPDLENWYFAPGAKDSKTWIKDTKDETGNQGGPDVHLYGDSEKNLDEIKEPRGYGFVKSNYFNLFQRTLHFLEEERGEVSDDTSVDESNRSEGNDAICLTNKTDYLESCIELNLAQEYRVINFDFYNDWINGTIYLPRWNKFVTKKRSYLFGLIKIPAKIKGCITSSNGGNNSVSFGRNRRYTQQCALAYSLSSNGTPQIKTPKGCVENDRKGTKQRCHKNNGFKQFKIFNKNGGVIQEKVTSRNQYVYYSKPCEWDSGKKVNLFASDIILLGTLNDCSEDGLPQAFKHLTNTSYIMPTNLALTNMDDDAYLYSNTEGTICSGKNIYENEGVNVVTAQSFSATEKFYANSTEESVVHDSMDDYVPMTEAAGIAWNYTGPDQGEPDFKDKFYQPGGHFLGLSCFNSETNIKSCVNLARICEVGASMSQRKEIIRDVQINSDGSKKYKYKYYVPTGLIGKDDIVDEDFRTMFATLNHNRLIADKYSEESGYLKCQYSYKNPSGFEGSIEKTGYLSDWYNKSMAQYVKVEWSRDAGDDFDNEITSNTLTRTINATNKDYYFFRLGINSFSEQYDKYLTTDKNGYYLFPMYENSFYFYFGLHPGATALDELNKQFFATCEIADAVDESGYEYVLYSEGTPEKYAYYSSVPQHPTSEHPEYINVNGKYYKLQPTEVFKVN